MEKKNWIKGAIKKPGALRGSLEKKKGEKITKEDLKEASRSRSSKTRQRANLAKTLIAISKKRKSK